MQITTSEKETVKTQRCEEADRRNRFLRIDALTLPQVFFYRLTDLASKKSEQFLLLIILITRHIPTQGGCGVRVPGGVQKMCGCCMGTRFSGGMVLVGGWLDWMALEVFSSTGDSIFL